MVSMCGKEFNGANFALLLLGRLVVYMYVHVHVGFMGNRVGISFIGCKLFEVY